MFLLYKPGNSLELIRHTNYTVILIIFIDLEMIDLIMISIIVLYLSYFFIADRFEHELKEATMYCIPWREINISKHDSSQVTVRTSSVSSLQERVRNNVSDKNKIK